MIPRKESVYKLVFASLIIYSYNFFVLNIASKGHRITAPVRAHVLFFERLLLSFSAKVIISPILGHLLSSG